MLSCIVGSACTEATAPRRDAVDVSVDVDVTDVSWEREEEDEGVR